jgi:hypothetical protein
MCVGAWLLLLLLPPLLLLLASTAMHKCLCKTFLP